MSDLPVTARGFVNTWQCDENDHLNVQFYTGWADEASPHLHAMLGLDGAQFRGVAVEDSIRYHREMIAADGVEVRSAPLQVTGERLAAYHEIRNGYDGTVAATIRRVTLCRSLDSANAPWPQDFVTAAQARQIELPEQARARTVGTRPLPRPTLAQAFAAGAFETGRGTIHAGECAVNGRITPRAIFGRMSDAAGFVWQGLGFDRAGMREQRLGTVVVEYRCRYMARLGTGSRFVLLSGLLTATDRILHLVHFIYDADSGRLAAVADGVGMKLDLEARRSAKLTDEDRTRLAGRVMMTF